MFLKEYIVSIQISICQKLDHAIDRQQVFFEEDSFEEEEEVESLGCLITVQS